MGVERLPKVCPLTEAPEETEGIEHSDNSVADQYLLDEMELTR